MSGRSQYVVLVGWVAACLALGCANLPAVSSGEVGCPASEIAIEDEELGHGFGPSTWTAICEGRRFYCTALPQEGGATVSCSEQVRSEAAPQAGGCEYDTQCKGDRVCNAGRCEAP